MQDQRSVAARCPRAGWRRCARGDREPPRRAASYVDKDKCQRSRRKHQIGSQGARDSWRLRRREAGVAPLGTAEKRVTAFRAAQGTELRLPLIVNNQQVAAAGGDTV